MSNQVLAMVSPMHGEIIPLADVPDPVFSTKVLGDGFGIRPSSDEVVAPVSGTVLMVADTRHAIGIATPDGFETLLHLGIDTVELEGKPFNITVNAGDTVTAGQAIGTMDRAAVTDAGKDTTTMMVITNSNDMLGELTVHTGTVTAGSPAAEATPKHAEAAAPVPAAGAVDDGLTGHDALARDIIRAVGGPENINSVIHCITRLRFYLKDQAKADDAAVTGLDGVIDIAKAGGQYQVVIGAAVADVYEALTKQLPTAALDPDAAPAEEVEKPTTLVGWLKFGFSSLIGVITGSMIPIIGLLAASGILKGCLALLLNFEIITDQSSTFVAINAMGDSVFFFLPIFVGFTAAKRLGADPIIVAIIGGVLTHPTIVEAAGVTGDTEILGMAINADFFGIPYHLAGYSYSIFPIIVAAWLASKVEPWLKRVIPATVRMIFVPFFEVFIVSTAILLVLGPVVTFLSGALANGIASLLSLNMAVAGLLIGGFYQALVIFGLHWAVIPLVANDIASQGNSYLNAIISATMVAQGGAVLAIFAKSKVLKIKELAGSAALSAFAGVTEPAMYGLNLKYGRAFITASIGGAVGGFLTGLLNVNMWGFTGSLIGFTSFVNPKVGIDSSFWGFWITSAAALIVSFVLTYMFGFSDADLEEEKTVKRIRLGRREPAGA